MYKRKMMGKKHQIDVEERIDTEKNYKANFDEGNCNTGLFLLSCTFGELVVPDF